ncbi:VOC family protein [Zavarzinella formosa]|uniref:VOC family protein n=1 Tax=Zavarzinella formosa TaxID=360055 RepID=UPI0002F45A0E|nr:VOC family protein [Zavarzinella formosa]
MNQCRLTLGVTDPARSAGFYRVFFDSEPVRVSSDAVVFAMSEPPLEVALTRSPSGKVAPIASQGLRFVDRTTVVARRERLHQAGLKTHTQECTHCGYNEQFKVHVADPDGHYWHLYVVDRLIHPNTIHRCLEGDEAVLPPDPVVAFFASISPGNPGRIGFRTVMIHLTKPACSEPPLGMTAWRPRHIG